MHGLDRNACQLIADAHFFCIFSGDHLTLDFTKL
jgi:hypothetical protein